MAEVMDEFTELNLRNSGNAMVGFIALIAKVFLGSAWVPDWSIRWPRNLKEIFLNSYFCLFSVTPAYSNSSLFSVARRQVSCSAWRCPNTMVSSTRHITPFSPIRIMFMCFWKSSSALDIPNSSLLKQYHPDGVMKVVRSHELMDNGICQKPLLASSLLNIFTPLSCARISLTLGRRCISLNVLFVEWLQVHTDGNGSTFFWDNHHGRTPWGQLVHFRETPNASMQKSSSATFVLSSRGTWWGEKNEYDTSTWLQFYLVLLP